MEPKWENSTSIMYLHLRKKLMSVIELRKTFLRFLYVYICEV